jgi:hypothetical protein
VSWIVDRGFDDVAVWRTIWEQEEHLVCRIRHRERLVEYKDHDGKWKVVRLLARLGGWVERKDNPPGKAVLTRGLRRIMDMLYTQAFLDHYREQHGTLPSRIAAWIGELPPPDL